MDEVIIIGAGLSGLSTAFLLQQAGITCKVLEAQDRTGGRIKTIYGNNATPMEMGATWFGKEHTTLLQFLSTIGIGYFEQHTEGVALFETMSFEPPQQYYVPANTHAAYRIKGGTSQITEALQAQIDSSNILLNTCITRVVDEGDQLQLTDQCGNAYDCKLLVIAMPPRLLTHSIQFSAALPQAVQQVMTQTQTWMSGSIKFAVEYKRPFWKEKGFSGSVYSQSGLATEIYDHSNAGNNKFAIKGFLGGTAIHYSLEERQAKVIAQLQHYFGIEANDYTGYYDAIWNDRFIQPGNDSFLPPHHNNGHPLYEATYCNGKLLFTGTETSSRFSGYMEGAVVAAHAAAAKIVALLKK